jgi:pyrroloquinoline quinone biosynthesis protein B
LGELRQNPDALCIGSSEATKSLLVSERAFERFDKPPHRWAVLPPDGTDASELLGGEIAKRFEVRAFDVPGLLPGFAGRQPWRGAVLAYAVRERATNASALFAPVYADLSDVLLEQIGRAGVALLDGSFYSDGELRAFGAAKDARGLGHLPVGGAAGTLARARGPGRRILTHVNNTNPILDESSAEYAAVRAAGFEVASDGDSYVLG